MKAKEQGGKFIGKAAPPGIMRDEGQVCQNGQTIALRGLQDALGEPEGSSGNQQGKQSRGNVKHTMTSGDGKVQMLPAIGLLMCLLLAEAAANVSFGQETSAVPLGADQVVQRMVERNRQRAQVLESYRGTRVYHLEYQGLSTKSATLVVTMTYRRPNEKKFCILSESGSELLQGRVLKRLLEAEIEAMQEEQRRQTALGPENYEFRLVSYEGTLEHGFYILEVTPRIKNKFLFRGRIWVEGQDFAVARMEGEPARNPSWWTKRNAIHVTYEKIGEFWLPARNETNTQLRIVGHSSLTIDYRDYEILNGASAQFTPASGHTLGCPGEPTKLSEARP